MEEWTETKYADFIHNYQITSFKENTNHFSKCNFKRQSIHQLLHASQSLCSNETTSHILKTKLEEYSSVVDKSEGVNNYAGGVLDIVSNNSFDSQKWVSRANASELLKEFLRPSKGECYNKSAQGCKAQKPTSNQLEKFLKTKKHFPTTLQNEEQHFPADLQNEHFPAPQNKQLFHAAPQNKQHFSFDLQNDNKLKDKQNFPHSVVETQRKTSSFLAPNPRPQPSNSSSVRGDKVRPSSGGVMHPIGSSVFKSNQSKPVDQTKAQYTPSFRTAGTELKLQSAKKYGHQAPVGGDAPKYGTSSKSLGGRSRSVNSKFVAPVKSEENETEEEEGGEVEDERLRLIDPKLVDLIRSEIMDFGPPVHWDHIAGLTYAKATIQEIVVLPMLRPDIFTGLRRPPKGILLFGPPGTGKTLIGKCIASQSKSTFFNISASSLTSKWVGEGEKMVRTLFTLARVHQPAVVFIDEIDSLLSQRSETEHESSRRIKTEFLVQLDGAGTGEEDRILVIGATNRPQELDEAARRRLVKRLYIPLPDLPARCQMVQTLMSSERHELTQTAAEEVAALTDGYSGADMKTLCQEACLGPIRALSFSDIQHINPEQVRPVTLQDFKSALQRVRSSVSPRDLETYVLWNQTYGSGSAA